MAYIFIPDSFALLSQRISFGARPYYTLLEKSSQLR